MKSSHIFFEKVDLSYASVAFKERSLKSLFGGLFSPQKNRPVIQDIHALKNINFKITSGERVGLLGHNGAGKSTLLKAIAELYPISRGKISIRGTVRSLFDLALGFEQEATGRDNILYRGFMFGLSPAYMRQREEEIVSFADIGEFIDYPVRTYSAGMQIRLAFAISTAVSGDILLLDEVIGVGDANFMKKAKKRIQELITKSEILLLASQDMTILGTFCQRGLVFSHGEIVFDGPIQEAISLYDEKEKNTESAKDAP